MSPKNSKLCCDATKLNFTCSNRDSSALSGDDRLGACSIKKKTKLDFTQMRGNGLKKGGGTGTSGILSKRSLGEKGHFLCFCPRMLRGRGDIIYFASFQH